MFRDHHATLLTLLLGGYLLLPSSHVRAEPPAVSFARDIQPLLARHCFACHGPDEEQRQADLRLDDREAAMEMAALVPGEPGDSQLIFRVTTDDPDLRMPPPDSGEKPLSEEDQQKLRQWIEQGARYERHWSFVPPARPEVPVISEVVQQLAAERTEALPAASTLGLEAWSDWSRNAIDHFVLRRQLGHGFAPSPEADRYALIRRVYLDLIGLPPTSEEADRFVQDEDPQAYERLVDQLLESKHYGERWGRWWLDLARYSDTNGYEKDRPRSIWPYRDWVIRALNDDMPFDRFTIEQLAGDMLPEATIQQRIATGFHRNTMLNEEGGIDPLEYRFYAMVDRVATTGTVWLGLTTGCAQCHSHKYDPISHTDYYRLLALLNNADEPDVRVPDPAIAERRRELEEQIARLEAELPGKFPPDDGPGTERQRRQRHLEAEFSKWLDAASETAVDWRVLRPDKLESNLPRLEVLPDGSIFSTGDITKRDLFALTFALEQPVAALRVEVLPDERLPAGGPGRAYYEGRQGDFFLSEVGATYDGHPVRFQDASHSYGKISIGSGNANAGNVIDGEGSTGWSTAGREGEPHQLVLNLQEPLPGNAELRLEMLFERHFAASLGRFRISASAATEPAPRAKEMPVDVERLLVGERTEWNDAERDRLRQYFLRTTPLLAEARKQIEVLRGRLPEFPTTMVLQERPDDNPRPTFRHHRGEYLSPKEQVEPGIPSLFGDDHQPEDRLEFARWLVSEDNPLVARVTVNRAWRELFGHGLVRTSGDFGTQSEPPTHPELLDWLAREFAEQGWSLKRLHRLLVTSATYRQSGRLTGELLRRDPENRFWARGPRHRLPAEMVRDSLLRASGLLSDKMFGPGVYPPQPASVTALAYGNSGWRASQGADRYRRSIYTFSKRTAPFAAFSVFDAPTGENCIARRDRSNTPLQALTLLNDQMYLEMARHLARVARGGEAARDDESARGEIVESIFRRVLTRPPDQAERKALLEFQRRQQQRLQEGELDAAAIAGADGASAADAAWVMVARAVMNLDEAVMKP